ncbi:hypothetical protein [Adhaeretor mobilis]|uniref:Uncharacterized protein n=1 Tax=Adhaeretor mobilis TaxID=1930276 RepID=A0A517MX79_9BACT|nr:hypothetical protein [Adhaeretor mobilis]QDS99417.1 hypothetical protein HG15A2_27400 [Adhaeretor mobilis]
MRFVNLATVFGLALFTCAFAEAQDRYAPSAGEDSGARAADLGNTSSDRPGTPRPLLSGEGTSSEDASSELGDAARRAFDTRPGERPAAPLPRRDLPTHTVEPATRQPSGDRPRNEARIAEMLIQQLSDTSVAPNLQGVSLSLADAVRDALTREAQTQRIAAYWDLSFSINSYHLATREADELRGVMRNVATPTLSMKQNEQDLEIRLAATERAMLAAQTRLQKLMGNNAHLPIPVDPPLCSSYETNYDQLFGQQISPAAKYLNDLIPVRYQQLVSEAESVGESYQQLAELSKQGPAASSAESLWQAHRVFSLGRRSFLNTVYDYNQDIAQYSQLARPQRLETQRLVAMHIGTAGEAFSGADTSVIPATAEEPIPRGRTFQRRESRRPIGDEAPEEEGNAEESLPEQVPAEIANPKEPLEEAGAAPAETSKPSTETVEAEKSELGNAEPEAAVSEDTEANDEEEISVQDLFGAE